MDEDLCLIFTSLGVVCVCVRFVERQTKTCWCLAWFPFIIWMNFLNGVAGNFPDTWLQSMHQVAS